MSDEIEKVRFEGRDLAEAIAAARRHFGVTRQEVGYELQQTLRIGPVLEGAPQVVILAWKRDAPPVEARPESTGGYGERRGPRDRGPRGDRGDRGDRGPRGGGGGFGRGGGRGRDRDDFEPPPKEARPREVEDVELKPLLPAAEVTEAKPILEQLAKGLVGGLGLDLAVAGIEETAAGVRVRLEGDDAGLLLESEAEGLEALQYLANRILQKDGRLSNRVSFDAGGFRAAAEKKLLDLAQQAADEVRRTGQPKKMPALGPYERRIVHVALAGMEGIKTFSTGSGYHRRLHVAPADAPEPAEADGTTPGDAPDA